MNAGNTATRNMIVLSPMRDSPNFDVSIDAESDADILDSKIKIIIFKWGTINKDTQAIKRITKNFYALETCFVNLRVKISK